MSDFEWDFVRHHLGITYAHIVGVGWRKERDGEMVQLDAGELERLCERYPTMAEFAREVRRGA